MPLREVHTHRSWSLLALTALVAIFGLGGSFPKQAAPEGVQIDSTSPAPRIAADGGSGPPAPSPSPIAVHRRVAAAANGRLALAPGALLGTWTVVYRVGRENGYGANIDTPLRRLDGRVIAPWTTFDFWAAVGEVSARRGYRRGGVIVGDHVDPDGALAGGICTVSTALFNAALRGGLDIRTRHAHSGYLARYPLGLDAAVSKTDRSRQTLAFRNDTPEPIVIRTVSLPGTARVDLYSAATPDRIVELSPPRISARLAARDRVVRTASLAPGERRRIADASDGMTVVVTRTVRDGSGRIVHRDRWVSSYRPLTGLVRVGSN